MFGLGFRGLGLLVQGFRAKDTSISHFVYDSHVLMVALGEGVSQGGKPEARFLEAYNLPIPTLFRP